MGSDSHKTHETYTIAPAVGSAPLQDAPAPSQTDPIDHGSEPQPPGDIADAPTAGDEHAAEAAVKAAAAPNPGGGEALIGVPHTAPAGDPNGVPLLVGGADLEDTVATLLAYHHGDGSREVLHARVTPDAEAKLLEALALSDEKLVPVTVDKQVSGRLPLDTDHQLYEQLEKVAKSVNHHFKAGDAIPDHTHTRHAELVTVLDELDAEPNRAAAEKTMLADYRAAAEAIGERLTPGYVTAYDAGGKVPHIAAYETTGTVKVTEMVPAPTDDAPEGLLVTRVRKATRINPTLEEGQVAWDGKARSKAGGHEYVIDLGDGYTAVYRPHQPAPGKNACDYSQRGALEVLAPPGAGHGPELVRRLGRLNLVNRPMTKAEGEWAYLQRNIEAQKLGSHPKVAAALADVRGLEDAVYFDVVADRGHEAVGMDDAGLRAFTRDLLLEAEARALPAKVAILRDGVAHAKGLADGAALTATPGYDPTPSVAGGWLQWSRFDVAADTAQVDKTFAGRGLTHRTSATQLLAMFQSCGVLACTERRRLMGVASGVGSSESADMETGGAKSVFLRVASKPTSGVMLYWGEPGRLLSRADWYAYPSDHYGAVNPAAHQYSAGKLTRDPHKIAAFNGSNEVMFANGIALTGAQAPTLIRCGGMKNRDQLLTLLKGRGVTHLGGRPAEQVIQP